MVLKAGQCAHSWNGAGGDHLTDGTPAARCGGDVQQLQAGVALAAAISHRGTQDLQPGAHGQGHRVGLHGPAQLVMAPEPVSSEELGGVLTPAQHVHRTVGQRDVTSRDPVNLGRNAPPAQPLGQDRGVTGIGVRAQHIGQQQADIDRGLSAHSVTFRSLPSRRRKW